MLIKSASKKKWASNRLSRDYYNDYYNYNVQYSNGEWRGVVRRGAARRGAAWRGVQASRTSPKPACAIGLFTGVIFKIPA